VPPVTIYAPPQPTVPLFFLPLAIAAGIVEAAVSIPAEVLLAPVAGAMDGAAAIAALFLRHIRRHRQEKEP
jgi:nitrate reductase gamma subunit